MNYLTKSAYNGTADNRIILKRFIIILAVIFISVIISAVKKTLTFEYMKLIHIKIVYDFIMGTLV